MRIYISFVCVFLFHVTLAQGIKVKEVKETVSGSDAFHAPIDLNGNPCGLVKVVSTIQDLTFDGEVVGKVENKTNEYHVFLARGSKELTIRRPHILPVKVNFAEYGLDGISSKATYIITLKDFSLNEKKNSTTFIVYPQNAIVFIDEIMIPNENEDGLYQLLLPKGEHVIRFEAKGYRSSVQIVKSGKEAINLSVELESLMATLDVRCETSTAEIWIDNDMKGKGAWQGKLPAGKYIIKAKQRGFVEAHKEITLEEKENSRISMPVLERTMGKLVIKTIPDGGDIFIDGQRMGKSGNILSIQTGQHTIVAKLPFGYKEGKQEVEVEEMANQTVQMIPKNEIYAAAFKGDIDKQIELTMNESNPLDSIEYAYWRSKMHDEVLKMDDNRFLTYFDKIGYEYEKDLEVLLRRAKINRDWTYPALKSMVLGNIVACYESLGNLREAIVWGEKVCEASPEYLSYKNLAQLYEKAGNKIKAIENYKKALGGDGFDSWAYIDLADAYYRLGYKEEAAKCYRNLINNWSPDLYKDQHRDWKAKLRELGY